MRFPTNPNELELHPLEEMLVEPIIIFLAIHELPVGSQKTI